eukprot:s1282_g5.t1
MQRCIQCNKWEVARKDLCALCRASLGIVQISIQDQFGPVDFDFAVNSLNQLLGNLTSRIVSAPPLRIQGGAKPAGKKPGPAEERSREGISCSAEAGTPRPAESTSRSSHVKRERTPDKVNIKSLPLSPERSKSERPPSSHRSRRSHREDPPESKRSGSRERSRRRKRSSPRNSPVRETPRERKGDWKPSLHLEPRTGGGVPEPDNPPPRVSLTGRSPPGVVAPSVPPPPPVPRREREEEAPAEEGWEPSEEGKGGKGSSEESAGDWVWIPKGKGFPEDVEKGKGKKGNVGKGGKAWKGKGKPSYNPYWWQVPEWKPKKKNRGLKRIEWWTGAPAVAKGAAKGKAKVSPTAPESAHTETPPVTPTAGVTTEVGDPATSAETGETSAGAGTAEPSTRSEVDSALRARESSWADATEDS